MFEAIPGQLRAKEYFTAALARGPGHAYLLAGEAGLGKTAFALELARALVTSCRGCGQCPECERAARGLHPDLSVIEREGEFIRIEQVAALIADLSLKPFAAARRVWVIREPERLNLEAANKFLKTLEEPPAHVHFVLVSDAPERLLPTIVSRCQVIDFQPVADEALAAHLVDREALDVEAARALAKLARGSVERARRLAEDARGAQRRARILKLAAAITGRDREAEQAFLDEVGGAEQAAAASAAELAERRLGELDRTISDEAERAWRAKALAGKRRREEQRLSRLACLDAVDYLVSWLRDTWAVSLGAAETVWNCDRRDELERATAGTPEVYARLLALSEQTRQDLVLNVDRRLALRAMFARFQEVWDSA